MSRRYIALEEVPGLLCFYLGVWRGFSPVARSQLGWPWQFALIWKTAKASM